jgi:diguanylate cyclase (GGDEF)-like protein
MWGTLNQTANYNFIVSNYRVGVMMVLPGNCSVISMEGVAWKKCTFRKIYIRIFNMSGLQYIFLLNAGIAAMYGVCFLIISFEIPQLKKYLKFALLMFLALFSFILEAYDYSRVSSLTRILLPCAYYSIGICLLIAFSIIHSKKAILLHLYLGNILLLICGLMVNVIIDVWPIGFRILNIMTLGMYTVSLLAIIVKTLQNRSKKSFRLVSFRTILLLPFLCLTFLGFLDQLLILFGLRFINDYQTLFFVQCFVLIALNISFTIEGASELIMSLQIESETDILTGVPNRRCFNRIVNSVLYDSSCNNENLCLATLDIDFFKEVNDTYGHDAGDLVLQGLSEKVSSLLRGTDLFARTGGEEFFLMFQNIPLDQVRNTCERIRTEIARAEFPYDKDYIKITISLGIARIAFKEEPLNAIIKRADRALYKAKSNGRNQCVIS